MPQGSDRISRHKKRRRVLPALWGAGLCWTLLCGTLGSVLAQESVVIRPTVSERLLADDNYRLAKDSEGWTYGSITSANVAVEKASPLQSLRLNLGSDFNRFTGPGAGSDLNSIDWETGARYVRRWTNTRLNGEVAYSQQAVSRSEVDDSGATDGGADRKSGLVKFGGSSDITSVDTISTLAQFRDVRFSGTESSVRHAFKSASLDGEWARQFTSRETGTVSAKATYFDSADPGNTESQAYTLNGSYKFMATSLLMIRAGAGFGAGIETTGTGTERETTVSPISNLDVGATYTLERSTVEVGLFQGVEPSSNGSLQQRRTFHANLDYRWTRSVALSLSASNTEYYNQFEFLPFGDESRNLSIADIMLSWEPVPNWRISGGYRIRYADDNDGSAMSNAIFATLTYRTSLFP